MGITNQFSWSKTRGAYLRDCARKYHNHYYAYWGGWSDNAPETARRLYKLRSLVSVPAWKGTLTHDTVAWVLQYIRDGGKPPALSKAFEYARKRTYDNWSYSQNKRYWSESKPRNPNWFGLIEHELDIPIPETTPEQVIVDIGQCLINLYNSDVFQRILTSDPKKWLHIEERSYFTLDGVKVWSVPDFMYTRDDAVVEIIDWKTGREQAQDDLMQLASYCGYARIAHDIPLDAIEATLVYLRGDRAETVTTKASKELVLQFREDARASMAAMTELIEDGDRERNRPLPVLQFAQTTDTGKCRYCNFRNECHPEGLANAA